MLQTQFKVQSLTPLFLVLSFFSQVLSALASHDNDSVPKRQISIVAEEATDVL